MRSKTSEKKKLVQGASIMNKVSPSSNHPLSMSRMQPNAWDKIKETRAANSYKTTRQQITWKI